MAVCKISLLSSVHIIQRMVTDISTAENERMLYLHLITNQSNHASRYVTINYVKRLINHFCEFKEVRSYRAPKLGGCQGPNADSQFTRPFGLGTYNL